MEFASLPGSWEGIFLRFPVVFKIKNLYALN